MAHRGRLTTAPKSSQKPLGIAIRSGHKKRKRHAPLPFLTYKSRLRAGLKSGSKSRACTLDYSGERCFVMNGQIG